MPTAVLFFAAVLIWGTTWITITFQSPGAAAEVAVALRFSLASLLLALWCLARGISLRLPRGQQPYLALLGALGFCLSYFLVYYAQHYIVTGLIAVGYAAMPLVNMLLARGFFGLPMSRRVAVGGLLGAIGIALIFWPEFARLSTDRPIVIGALLTAAAVLASALSNMVVMRNQAAGLAGWAPLALAMGYGALTSWIAVALLGRPLAVQWSWPFTLSLLYLAVFGSVLAFGAYYAVLARIGPARAAYVGVMATVVALAVSALFEGYQWRLATAAGIALAVLGNVLALQAPMRPAAATTAARPSDA